MKLSNSGVCRLLAGVFIAGLIIVLLSNHTFAQRIQGEKDQAQTLLGRWQSEQGIIEFRADGSISIFGDTFAYTVRKSVITVSSDEGSLEFPFRLDGDELIVSVEGNAVVYTRLSAGDKDIENAPAGRGGILPELVGQWCYLSNTNLNSTNSRVSQRCFTLYEDGTYEYFSQGSSSGNYGSSASEESDGGRWSATANSITAYSNKNGKLVFSLEKRNHPKTGDPMLVLDGEAFVTAQQREPW